MKQFKKVLNEFIQELNHDQRILQIEHKARREPVNEIKVNMEFHAKF